MNVNLGVITCKKFITPLAFHNIRVNAPNNFIMGSCLGRTLSDIAELSYNWKTT